MSGEGYPEHPDLLACANLTNYSCLHDFIEQYDHETYKRCVEFMYHMMSYPEYQMKGYAAFVLYGVILSTISIFGILGNFISFWIMLTPEFKKSTTTIYLRILMIMDSLYLLTNFFHYSLITGLQVSQWWINALPAYSRVYIYYSTIDLIRNASALQVMAVTVERYIFVCHGFNTVKMRSRAKIAAAVMMATAIVYEIPRYFILQVNQVQSSREQNSTNCGPIYVVEASGYIPDSVETVIDYTGTVLFVIIPMVTLVILTSRLLSTIKKSRAFQRTMGYGRAATEESRRANGNPRRVNDSHTTVVLLSVVITFIVCNLPNTFISMARLTLSDSWDRWNLTLAGSLFYYIAIILINLNSAVNVILFCFFGQKFRDVFVRIFFKCQCKLRQRESYSQIMHSVATHNIQLTTRTDRSRNDACNLD